MTWQDLSISAIQLVFTASMWATIRNPRAQVSRWTSVTTSIGLWSMAGIFLTLELWTASSMASLCASAWSFIAVYRPIHKEVPTLASPNS